MADEELGSMLCRVRITEDADGILHLHAIWKQEDSKMEKLHLVGKLLSQRRINLNGLHNALMVSWNTKKAFKISEIGEKIYLFQFSDIGDLNKALHRGLWNFSNSLLILKRFQPSLTAEQYNFSTNPFWVRIFDVHIGMHSEQIGYTIGNSLGQVLEVDDGFRKAIRVRVELEVNQPLRRFKTSQITATESKKLRIKYERLPEFCFVCGCLGHFENDCEIANSIKDAGGKIVRMFRSWLKAELGNSWCPDDFDILDEDFAASTQFLVGDAIEGNKEHLEDMDSQSVDYVVNQAPACQTKGLKGVAVSQNEGIKDAAIVERNGHDSDQPHAPANLPIAVEEQLVELPLSLEFGSINKTREQGKTAKGGKGKWKRIERVVESHMHLDKTIQNKRKSCTEFVEDQRACKVIVGNTGVALVSLAKDHDPSTG